MKILISSGVDERSLAREYIRGIRSTEPAIELIEFAHSDLYRKLAGANLFTKFVSRLAPSIHFTPVSRRLVELAVKHKPEVIWLFKGMEFSPAILRKLQKLGCILVNYNADHPLRHFSKGSGNKNVTNGVGLYDLYITYSREIAADLNATHPNLVTQVIPFGHSVDNEVYAHASKEEEVLRACFVGNPDPDRVKFLKGFADAGVPLDIWGYGWRDVFAPHPQVAVHSPSLGAEYWHTLYKYRIQLNLFRPHNQNSHNMRSFEVPAIGGVMLAPVSVEHLEFFESEKEAFFYNSLSDAIMWSKRLLSASRNEVTEVRKNARHRCENSGYRYADRAREALGMIQSVKN